MKRVDEIRAKRKKPRQKTVIAPIVPLADLRSMFLQREKMKSFAATSRRESMAQSPPPVSEPNLDDHDFFAPLPPQNKEIIAGKWLAVSAGFQRLNALFRVLEHHRKVTTQFDLE